MDNREVWLEQANILDKIYESQKEIASWQLKQAVDFLVVEHEESRFFPIKRLVDGIENRPMDARKCLAQEMIRYSHSLKQAGFEIIERDHRNYNELHTTYLNVCNYYKTSPSKTQKKFWVLRKLDLNSIISVMDRFANGERPDNFGLNFTWHVIQPKTGTPYPLKAIWALATTGSCNDFKSNEAIRRKLQILGLCAFNYRIQTTKQSFKKM